MQFFSTRSIYLISFKLIPIIPLELFAENPIIMTDGRTDGRTDGPIAKQIETRKARWIFSCKQTV